MAIWRRKPSELKELRNQVASLQHTIRITSEESLRTSTSNAGNPYATASTQIEQLNKMYEGTAEWGCDLMQVLVDIRSSYIIGDGIQAVYDKQKGGEREKEVIDKFMADNHIDKDAIYAMAKSAQIEGRRLARLIPDPFGGTTVFQWVPYTQRKYKIETDPDDYTIQKEARYHLKSGREMVLSDGSPQGWFVYRTFGGQSQYVNDARPHLGSIIQLVEDVHRSGFDIRKGNAYFGFPTPYFEVETGRDADTLGDALVAKKWLLGQFLAATAKGYMLQADLSGIDALVREITNKIQRISARSGVPVHRLGFPDVVNARATADDSASGSEDVILSDRLSEMAFWTSVFDKVIQIKASQGGYANLKPGLVHAEVAGTSTTKIQMLREVFLKLREQDPPAISLETLLEKVPGIDVTMERQRLDKEQKDRDARESQKLAEESKIAAMNQPKPPAKMPMQTVNS